MDATREALIREARDWMLHADSFYDHEKYLVARLVDALATRLASAPAEQDLDRALVDLLRAHGVKPSVAIAIRECLAANGWVVAERPIASAPAQEAVAWAERLVTVQGRRVVAGDVTITPGFGRRGVPLYAAPPASDAERREVQHYDEATGVFRCVGCGAPNWVAAISAAQPEGESTG